jgi:endo-1,4-beta-xylanase
VGEQGHWLLDDPPATAIEAMIVVFEKLGLKTVITELDIDPLPRPEGLDGADVSKRVEFKSTYNPYTGSLPDAVQTSLAQRYADVFGVFLKHRSSVRRVTLWGVTDADTWLNDWPIQGRTNHPLLWDRDGRPKPSFDAVVETARRALEAP